MLGHEVHVITSCYKRLARREFRDGISIWRVDAARDDRLPGFLQSTDVTTSPSSLAAFALVATKPILDLVRKFQLEVVHCGFAFPSGPPGIFASYLTRTPCIVSILGADIYDPARFRVYRKLVDPIVAWTVVNADAVTALSGDLSSRITALCGRKDISVIPFGIDTNRFAYGEWSRHRTKRVITVGRLVKRKRIDILLRAWPNVKEQVPAAELLIVGAGPERSSLQKLAADLGLHDVIFKSFRVQDLKQPDLLSLYTMSSVFVCSSEHEGLYLAGLEAMSCGLPVVAPRIGGITDWLLHGETGFLYDFGDHDALARYVIELLRNESLCERLSVAARKRAQEFDLSVVARRWEDLYRKVAAEGIARV